MVILAHNAKLESIMAGIQLEATVLSHSQEQRGFIRVSLSASFPHYTAQNFAPENRGPHSKWVSHLGYYIQGHYSMAREVAQ